MKILSENQFDIIKSYLGGISLGDEWRPLTQERSTILIEKLKILIDIGICANIEEIINKNSFASRIIKCFEIAKCQKQIDSKN